MDEKEIRKYAALMKELGLSGLEINDEGKSIRLEMGGNEAYCMPAAPAVGVKLPEEAQQERDDFDTITSPMIGIFYAAPAEDAEAYVKTGDKVKKGDILCIIEAMKLMNEITAEYDGIIEEICVSNAQTVEFGTPLFRVRR